MTTLDDKVRDACHRIEELYYETDGKCYVSFSGGKDSTVLLALIKLCEDVYTIPPNAIPAVFSNTGIELGVTVDFVKWVKENYYENMITIRPVKSFDEVLKISGKPMKSKLKAELLHRWQTGSRTKYVKGSLIDGVLPTGTRAERTKIADKDVHMLHDDFPVLASADCCEWMKKKAFRKFEEDGGYAGGIVGIRTGEGGARTIAAQRRVREGGKLCTFYQHGHLRKAPIIDWSEEDVDGFIERYNVPLSDAYTKYGFKRTGCMACPFAWDLSKDLQYLYEHEPNRYKAAMHWLKDVYIAQDVRLSFDEAYEREREYVANDIRTNATRDATQVPTELSTY